MRLKQVGVVCYICGREFGTRSIGIHEPQCMKKWENQNNKLPKSKRQPKPVKPVEFDEPFSTDPKAKAAQIEKYNQASNAAATENLVPCKNCSRSFLPARIEAHEKVCLNLKMAPPQRLKSNSGYYGQRIVVVDGEQVDAIAMKKENTFSSNTIVKKKASKPPTPANNYSTNVLQNKSQSQGNMNVSRGPLQTVPCQFCGKAISHNAINIHIKKCKSRSEPLPQTTETSACTYCNKKYPPNVIAVHIRNCSAAPKKIFPPKGPAQSPALKKTPSKPQLQTPPSTPPKRIPPLSNNTNNVTGNTNTPYSRYSPRARPPSADKLTASLDTVSLNSSYSEVEVDLVLGVDPALVMNCMVCGLIVLKSKLNTHYHNYCQKPAMTRSITIPPSTQLPKPPLSPPPKLVPCEICNRNFRADVIEEHEIRCAMKNQEELSRSMTSPEVSPARNDPVGGQFSTNGLSSPTQVVGKFVTGKFVPCINCGKSFTLRSLVIHQKQCMK